VAKLTISDASRACGVSRTTIQRAVKAGRLSLDAEHQVDTAELLRLGYTLDAALLHAASQQGKVHAQRDAAAQGRSSVQEGAAEIELRFLRQQYEQIQQERDRLVQQVQQLQMQQAQTQQHLTQAQQMQQDVQQMLHAAQQRYDRLLDAPRPLSGLSVGTGPQGNIPVSVSPAAPRGDMRQRILTLLRDYPDGLSPAQTRQRLGIEKDLGATMQAMLRDGLLRRIETGRYSVR
jgi:hypothetical protein